MLKRRFSEEFGYTNAAINGKIRNGVWTEGKEYFYAPDGNVHIIIDGYLTWLYSTSEPAKRNIENGYFN